MRGVVRQIGARQRQECLKSGLFVAFSVISDATGPLIVREALPKPLQTIGMAALRRFGACGEWFSGSGARQRQESTEFFVFSLPPLRPPSDNKGGGPNGGKSQYPT